MATIFRPAWNRATIAEIAFFLRAYELQHRTLASLWSASRPAPQVGRPRGGGVPVSHERRYCAEAAHGEPAAPQALRPGAAVGIHFQKNQSLFSHAVQTDLKPESVIIFDPNIDQFLAIKTSNHVLRRAGSMRTTTERMQFEACLTSERARVLGAGHHYRGLRGRHPRLDGVRHPDGHRPHQLP